MTQNCLCGKSLIDLAIVGAGPGGLTAGLYGARAGLHTVVYGDPYEGQLARAGTVENFPTQTGSPTGLSIIEKMVQHAGEFDYELIEKKVKQISRNLHDGHNIFTLTMENGDCTCAYSVILATGTKHKKLGVKGEEEYYAKGVSYCTICDGPLYKDLPVAIVGFGDEAIMAALRMTNIASQVYFVASKPKIGGDPNLRAEIENEESISVYEDVRILEISGGSDGNVNQLILKQRGNQVSLEIGAAFIEVGVLPSSAIASGVGIELAGQFIKVDHSQATNVHGFFAAGDITGGQGRQAIISAGDGAKAAISVIDYIKRLGVSHSKLKTTQWGSIKGNQKAKQKQTVLASKSGNALYDYVHSDEGFAAAYQRYVPDDKLIREFVTKMPTGKIVTVSAHWCPDCRRNVPRMAKITEEFTHWDIVVEDRDKEGVREKYNIRKIPTFIIFDKDGNEINRIIENPKYQSLEEDLIKIADGNY